MVNSHIEHAFKCINSKPCRLTTVPQFPLEITRTVTVSFTYWTLSCSQATGKLRLFYDFEDGVCATTITLTDTVRFNNYYYLACGQVTRAHTGLRVKCRLHS